MPTIVPVRFRYAARDLWFDAGELGAVEGDHLVCSTERGTEIGLATSDPREVGDDELRAHVGDAALKPVVRVATDDDLARAEELAARGDAALPTFRRLAAGLGLDMKPVGVEYVFGGERVVCYFSSEGRVDFRQLVRELSHELHARVDMRQIGVREQAAIVGGYGHCGQELCCARIGLSFESVSIRMAKEQDLPLNSTKISGACGRLMCCLRYEFEAYRDFKGRAPKKNAVIHTPLGVGKIVEYDTPKEAIAIRLENGKVVRVPLAEMTASEAAVKKSEELGCPCRPDTVTRAALERLQSADVQMALAELDRKAGVLPAEGPDASDIFVAPRRRRRSGGSGGGAAQGRPARDGDASQAQAEGGEDGAQTRERRRRPRRQGAPEGAAAQAGVPPQPAEGEGAPRRRRRRHRQGEPAAAAPQQAPQAPAPEAPSGAQGDSPAAKPRRRRHPGDKGRAQGQGEAGPTAPSGPASQDAGQAPAPRRRHRRHRGGGSSSAPSAPDAPSGA